MADVDLKSNISFVIGKGEKGDTPYIGDNGNWWIAGEDTGKPSKGADGQSFTYDMFTPEQLEALHGQDGTDGTDGVDGEDGFSPIASITQTTTGATITITDLSGTTTATILNGNGKDGKDGTNGVDGKDGKDGTNGVDGVSPTATITPTANGATISITDKNGTTTATLTNGTNGRDGVDGQDGQNGRDGVDGTNGQDGVSPTATITPTATGATISITDKNGTTTATITNGANGQDGTNGRDGVDGTNGTNGEDGFSPTASVTQTSTGATITITDKNGTTTATVNNGTGADVDFAELANKLPEMGDRTGIDYQVCSDFSYISGGAEYNVCKYYNQTIFMGSSVAYDLETGDTLVYSGDVPSNPMGINVAYLETIGYIYADTSSAYKMTVMGNTIIFTAYPFQTSTGESINPYAPRILRFVGGQLVNPSTYAYEDTNAYLRINDKTYLWSTPECKWFEVNEYNIDKSNFTWSMCFTDEDGNLYCDGYRNGGDYFHYVYNKTSKQFETHSWSYDDIYGNDTFKYDGNIYNKSGYVFDNTTHDWKPYSITNYVGTYPAYQFSVNGNTYSNLTHKLVEVTVEDDPSTLTQLIFKTTDNTYVRADKSMISGTSYTNGYGLNLNGNTFSVDTGLIATQSDITTINNTIGNIDTILQSI